MAPWHTARPKGETTFKGAAAHWQIFKARKYCAISVLYGAIDSVVHQQRRIEPIKPAKAALPAKDGVFKADHDEHGHPRQLYQDKALQPSVVQKAKPALALLSDHTSSMLTTSFNHRRHTA